jgi:hypothetical protein
MQPPLALHMGEARTEHAEHLSARAVRLGDGDQSLFWFRMGMQDPVSWNVQPPAVGGNDAGTANGGHDRNLWHGRRNLVGNHR